MKSDAGGKFMRKTVKNELAIVSGLVALACVLARRRKTAAIMAGFSVGLCLTEGKKPFSWDGKSVFITGGSRGLGLALAREFLLQGAKVTLAARKFEELARARKILSAEYPAGEVCTVICDVTKKNELAIALKESINTFGVLDAVVNNAGAIGVGPLESMTRADFEAQMKLHLYAVIEATDLVRPYFKRRGGGRIINICSLGGKSAVPHMLPYNASKFALAGYSQGAAIELHHDNITVTTVYPALMRTGSPIQAVFKGDHDKEFAWFDFADNFPLLSMAPAVAAKKILKASSIGDSELVLSSVGKLRVLSGVLFPELVNGVMVLLGSLMPKGQSGVRRTGYQSRTHFESSFLTKPMKSRAREAELKNNQFPSDDAEFNLGLR